MAAGEDVFQRDLSRSPFASALARDLYRDVRSRYHGLCLELNNKASAGLGLEVAFPFLDRDLIHFVMSVPGELLARDGAPKALLREGLNGIVPDAILRRKTKGDFTHIVNEASRRDYAHIGAILGPDALVVQMGYVEARRLKLGIDSARSALDGSASNAASWRLSSLLGFELWLREFIGHENEETPQWRSNARATV
jgi:asparagine synthase (glutamine-hydrolysing)